MVLLFIHDFAELDEDFPHPAAGSAHAGIEVQQESHALEFRDNPLPLAACALEPRLAPLTI
jgi:hypothetical protein